MSANLSRRDFLKISAAAVGTAAVLESAPFLAGGEAASAASPGDIKTSVNDVIVAGACSLCPSGCGTLARVADGNVVKLEGNPMHPVNSGALCPKGQAAPELLYHPDRLNGPQKRKGERGSGQWETITWDEAIQTMADKLTTLRSAGQPEKLVFMAGDTRGQLRPLFERFMQAVGSPNFVRNESLNLAAAKLGVYLTQGVYDLPVYDLENSRYILSFGASLLEAGPNPLRTITGVSYSRRGRATRSKVVMIDPRQGVTGAKADEWIPITPGTDAALALGICNVIIRSSLFDSDFIHNYSFGFEDFSDEKGKTHKGFMSYVLENYDPTHVEKITGVPASTIARLAGEFASNGPSVAIIPGRGGLLNGSVSGVYAAMAVHMLNALVGSLDRPGGVLTQRYFPSTDWPALPTDDVAAKGLASERVDGAGTVFPLARSVYQAVADRVLAGQAVEALFLYDANPVFDAPGGQRFVEAFKKIPFIVSFATFADETAQFADLILPEATFLERWQDDAIHGLGYPGVALRQPAIEPRLQSRNSGDVILQITQALGGEIAKAFPWKTFEEVVQFRLKDIGVEWKTFQELGVWLIPGYRYAHRGDAHWTNEVVGRDRRNAPRDGRFDFYSRELSCLFGTMKKDQLAKYGISQTGDAVCMPHYENGPQAGDIASFPLRLNVITLMSLGPVSAAANLPTLQEISGMTVGETWNSWLEMNPATASGLGLADKDLVWIESPFGKLKTKMRLVKGLHPGVVNLPYNQGHTSGRFAGGRGVNGLEILNPASEPASGLAIFTNTNVKVYRA
ncbi:MAG: molybdopterin-dependent oxidoreductase [Chloroflexota bacterium]